MKKRIVHLFMAAGFLLLVGACSNEPTAKESMDQYVDKWNKQNFEEMYDQLSTEAQKSISKDEFVKRNKSIYEQVGVSDLKVSAVDQDEKNNDKKETQTIPYKVSMKTLAGPVSFEGKAKLVKEEKDGKTSWNINWNPSFIFSQLKKGETIRITAKEPVRGSIYDRNGKALATNATVPEIGVVRGELGDDKDGVLKKLAGILDMKKEDIEKQLSAEWVQDDSFIPLKKAKPNEKDVIKKATSLPGVLKQDTTSRFYPYGEKAAHLTGYIRPITEEELKQNKDNYSQTSLLGIVGLEHIYEKKLRGEIGWTISIPESGATIASKDAKDGTDIHTTIDIKKQEELYSQLKDDSGAAVALQPQTGETLALVSAPSYDPNGFLFGWKKGEWEKLNKDGAAPFTAKFNKTYAPGSTIKPITASIGLKNGAIKADEKKQIIGKEWQKDSSWGGYKVARVSEQLSEVDLENALITSDNIYFAQTAIDTGKDKFIEGLKSFGFEEKLDYEFPTTASSISNDGIDSEILLGDTAYGQGQMLMSPIHLAAAYTPFLNDGDLIKPRLIKKDGDEKEIWHKQLVTPDEAAAITKGLKGVVEDPRGSAYKPVAQGLTIAGKTGTAELKKKKDEKGKENGWFTAYDYKNKDLLITMMIEDVSNRGGSSYVVNKVKQIFK
ncbi:penicillin-binding transpeptidase domain-containing protein [Bacillus sonorensis]|uniref:penicillin-binding transpeptidase domain-containing protein n=1 Tax=Bacillus sonorensis TaxID=119858 RepID=UPI0004961688|nr:penicillin-binding transpeptidase domain-containing protein [Bacillus sonorensis]MCY8405619.1 penicillin-binding transpeptidase domain-containing protein [Bacillus sonorensis]MCZ0069411.1 penicillin-binding transpeptidase domain-containing protein [Bacillus sonorensis]MCZ0096799.1 penicillin-binding transpeptidase domain-containing protein [Bacillus sonorensis]MEC1517478.1 penicillin-binding transpeptidase domain-containing protein [Bacillus sonorensis]MEC1590216.1 penicillin-binding transp